MVRAAGGEACAVSVGHGHVARFSPDTVSGIPVVILELPSGREIVYWDPEVDVETGDVTVDSTDGRNHVYGGLLCENLTQAVAFDLLLASLLALHERYADKCRVIMHIHDEIVVECAEADAPQVAATVKRTMEAAPPWAFGLVLRAEPEIMRRYRK